MHLLDFIFWFSLVQANRFREAWVPIDWMLTVGQRAKSEKLTTMVALLGDKPNKQAKTNLKIMGPGGKPLCRWNWDT